MPKQNLKLKKTFYRTACPCLRAKGEGGASWWTMSARWICSWTMLETKNLNNAWDQDQKFELWMRPRPNNFWDQYQKLNNAWATKKTTPKLPEVILADREGVSSSKDLFRPLRRRRTRKMKTTTIIQGAEPFGGLIQIHWFNQLPRIHAYVWNWILGIPTKYKKMSHIKGKPPKNWIFFQKTLAIFLRLCSLTKTESFRN